MRKISILVTALLMLCIVATGCSSNGIKKKDAGGKATLIISCQAAIDYGKRDEEGFSDIIPEDGIYYEKENVTFAKEDSVKSFVERELTNKKIPFEFNSRNTIDSINGLKAKDCGAQSGWACYINDKYTMYSYDSCKINDGDKIEIVYYTSYVDMMKKR